MCFTNFRPCRFLCFKYFLLACDFLFSSLHRLQIEGEKSFADVSRVVAAAMHWEERAKDVLACNAHMSEFVDLLRFDVPSLFFLTC